MLLCFDILLYTIKCCYLSSKTFSLIEESEEFDHTGRSVYIETCKKNGVIPASYFLRHMHDSQLEMKHHGLGPQGVKPLCVSLVVSI